MIRHLTFVIASVFIHCVVVAADDGAFHFPEFPRNQFVLRLYHLSPVLEAPEIGQQTSFSSVFSWTNTYTRRRFYLFDAETKSLDLRLNHPLSPNVSLGASVPVVWQGGGVLDSTINSWHRVFGFRQAGRSHAERNAYFAGGKLRNGGNFYLDGEEVFLGDVNLSSTLLLSKEAENVPASSLRLGVALPTSTSQLGQSSVDGELSLCAAKHLWSLEHILAASYIYYGDANVGDLPLEKHHLQLEYGVGVSLSQAWTMSAAFQYESALTKEIPSFPSSSFYLDLALDYQLTVSSNVAFLIRENPGTSEGSADVSFVISAQTKL